MEAIFQVVKPHTEYLNLMFGSDTMYPCLQFDKLLATPGKACFDPIQQVLRSLR
jgi:hypothetical protein